jgi:hypothetical protein
MTESIAHAVAEILDSTPLGGRLSDAAFADLVDDVLDDLARRLAKVPAA